MSFRASLRVARRSATVFPPTEESELVRAIRSGRNEDVPRLLRNRGPKDRGILALACRLKQIETVQLLLDAEEPIDQRDSDNKTPLHRACEADSKEILQMLINRGASIDVRDRERHTLLHTCAIYNSLQCVELISTLDLNAQDHIGASPIHHAAHANNSEFVRWLIEHGAQLNSLDNSGRQALHYAASMGNANSMEVLLECGAEVDPLDSDSRTPLMLAAGCKQPGCVLTLVKAGSDVNLQDRTGFSALHHAGNSGCEASARILLTANASLDSAARAGLTPLHVASSAFEGAHALHAMLQHEEFPPLECRDSFGRTPLHIAVRHGVNTCVAQLIFSDANPNACDSLGRTPLHLAVQQRQLESLDRLLNARTIDINARDHHWRTPLHYAAIQGDQESVSTLLGFGGDPNICDDNGQSVHFYAVVFPGIARLLTYSTTIFDIEGRNLLHVAAKRSEKRAFDFILQQLPLEEIHRQDNYGRTPLHYACAHDESGLIVRALLDAGADALVMCHRRLQPIHYAAGFGRKNTVVALLEGTTIPWSRLQLKPPPACLAAYYGHLEALHVLLEAGVCDNISRCLELAALQGQRDCVELLIRTLVAIKHTANGGQNASFSDNGATPIEQLLNPALSVAALALQNKCFKVLLAAANRIELLHDSLGRTPLMLASLNCRSNYNCIERLLQRGADVRLCDHNGRSLMFYATFSGHEEAVQHFARLGSSCILPSNRGKTPLHIAAALGFADILSCLIRYGGFGRYSEISSPAESDASGDTRSSQQSLDSRMDVADVVKSDNVNMESLKNSPDLKRKDLPVSPPDASKEQPEALSPAPLPIMDDIQRVKDTLESRVAEEAKKQKVEEQTEDQFGNTESSASTPSEGFTDPISNASSSSGKSLFLLQDAEGFDPLHWAAYCGRGNALTILLENSAKSYSIHPRYGVTPLHLAAFNGNLYCMKLLLQHFGITFALEADDYGRQVFHYLVQGMANSDSALTTAVKYLIESNAQIDAIDTRGKTPLMYAIEKQDAALCDILLEAGADTMIKDPDGNLPLHLACAYSMESLGIRLVSNKPDIVNIENNEKNTPLHLAAKNGLVELTRQLLANDADVYAKNSNSQTPYLSCIKDPKIADCLDLILTILVYEERKELETALENERLKNGQMQFSSPISNTNRRSIIERRSRSSALSPSCSVRSSISFNIDCSEISLFRPTIRVSLDPESASTPTEPNQSDPTTNEPPPHLPLPFPTQPAPSPPSASQSHQEPPQ